MPVMRTVLGSAAPKLLALFVFCSLGCQPKPGSGPGLGKPGLISCATEVAADRAVDFLGPVNGCLAGESDIQSCLLGLVQPAVGATLAVIGCLTKHEGAAARSAAEANPFNDRDKRRAARAGEFLGAMEQRGYRFED
jgi:hypothetical protein